MLLVGEGGAIGARSGDCCGEGEASLESGLCVNSWRNRYAAARSILLWRKPPVWGGDVWPTVSVAAARGAEDSGEAVRTGWREVLFIQEDNPSVAGLVVPLPGDVRQCVGRR